MSSPPAATGAILEATVLTLDRSVPRASAVAWRGDTVIAVGDERDVRPHLDAKRAAMGAHESQRGGGRRPRSLDIFLRLPTPIFAKLFGREWFIETGVRPPEQILGEQPLSALGSRE